MTAEPPDRPNLHPPHSPESATSDVGERRPWPPPAILWPWLGVNTLGSAIVTTILILIAFADEPTRSEALSFSGVVVGGLVGPMQAFILRDQVPRLRIWEWVLASIVSGYLGIFLGAIVLVALIWMMSADTWMMSPILEAAFPAALSSIFGAILGASVGLGQVVVLARHVLGLRRWWVANVIGRSLAWLSASLLWTLVVATVSYFFPDRFWQHFIIGALLGTVIGLIYGGVTARAIPRLTPRQRSVADSSD